MDLILGAVSVSVVTIVVAAVTPSVVRRLTIAWIFAATAWGSDHERRRARVERLAYLRDLGAAARDAGYRPAEIAVQLALSTVVGMPGDITATVVRAWRAGAGIDVVFATGSLIGAIALAMLALVEAAATSTGPVFGGPLMVIVALVALLFSAWDNWTRAARITRRAALPDRSSP